MRLRDVTGFTEVITGLNAARYDKGAVYWEIIFEDIAGDSLVKFVEELDFVLKTETEESLHHDWSRANVVIVSNNGFAVRSLLNEILTEAKKRA